MRLWTSSDNECMHAAEKLICIGVWCTCHTYEHTYIHTYIHIHIQILVKSVEKQQRNILGNYASSVYTRHTYIHIYPLAWMSACRSLEKGATFPVRSLWQSASKEVGYSLRCWSQIDTRDIIARCSLGTLTATYIHTYIHTYHTYWNFCQLFYIDNTCMYACIVKAKSSGVGDLIGMHVLYVCMYVWMNVLYLRRRAITNLRVSNGPVGVTPRAGCKKVEVILVLQTQYKHIHKSID